MTDLKKAIKQAHSFADDAIDKAQEKARLGNAMKWLKSPINISKGQGTLIAIALLLLFVSCSADAACTYRKDALGATVYSCTNGVSGRITTDVLGTSRDSATGETWRTDVLGNVRSSTGTVYRTDVLGNIRSNKGDVWTRDALGNLRGNSGTVCRADALGQVNCR